MDRLIGADSYEDDVPVITASGTGGSTATLPSSSSQAGSKALEPYDSRTATGNIGLYNQGATCYLNSLIQLLYHISYFRQAVYRMSTEGDAISAIPKALQSLFFQLQERKTTASTSCLTDAFEWTEKELFVQHDIQELLSLLRDNLEGKMNGTPSEGVIKKLFRGDQENVISCLDGTYTSSKKEEFYDLHLDVQNHPDIYSSIKSLVAKEQLVGDNKYKVEYDEEGKPAEYKDAEKGLNILAFPPVLICHLKRFEMDLMSPTLEMKKINSRFAFPDVLDLKEFEKGYGKDPSSPSAGGPDSPTMQKRQDTFQHGADDAAEYDLFGIIVHKGSVRCGHYYAYMRDYDHTKNEWGSWLEFDDEHVTRVEPEKAIQRHYGGFTHSTHNPDVQIPLTHSAYILAYVRRCDAQKVLAPTSTDSIPMHVKEEFARILVEEEKAAREEMERNRMATFHVVFDEDIALGVNKRVYDLAQKEDASFTVSFPKSEPLRKLYMAIEDARGGTIDATRMRLWLWAYGYQGQTQQSLRPTGYAASYQDAADLSIQDALVRFHSDATAWTDMIYVELPRECPPIQNLNAAVDAEVRVLSHSRIAQPERVLSSDHMIKFEVGDEPSLAVLLKKEFTVQRVVFRLPLMKNAFPFNAVFDISLYGGEGDGTAPIASRNHRVAYKCNQSNPVVVVQFPGDGVRARSIKITRTGFAAKYEDPMWMQGLSVVVPAGELPQLPSPRGRILPPMSDNHYMLMLKYFNVRTATLTYLGPVVVPITAALGQVLPIVRKMLNMHPDTEMKCCDEFRPANVYPLSLYFNSTQNENNLMNGNIVTVQVHPQSVPQVYRYLNVEDYYRFIDDRRVIHIRNVNHPEQIVAVADMQAQWTYNDIALCVSQQIDKDANYIQLYSAQNVSGKPRSEPERTDNNKSLDHMLQVGPWQVQDIFFDVLTIPVRDAEAKVHITLTLASEMGAPHHKEEFLFPEGTTIKQAIVQLLKIADVPFDMPFVVLQIHDHRIDSHNVVYPDQDDGTLLRHPRYRCTTEVRPYKPPESDDEETMYVVQADAVQNPITHVYPWFHSTPFLLNVGVNESIDAVLDRVVAMVGCSRTEIREEERGLMMYSNQLYYFPDDKPVKNYFTPQQYQYHIRPFLVFNRKCPKEKPGSRYVAQKVPALVIDKRERDQAEKDKAEKKEKEKELSLEKKKAEAPSDP